MFINTENFREQAIYFTKYKKYDCGERGSNYYKQFWDEERRRCLYGYSVGGVWIPGSYYWYLNYCPINIVEANIGKDGKKSKSGGRKKEFPKFWDLDYAFFMSLSIAKNGIEVEEYKKLPYDLNIKLDEENLEGGHHLAWIKPRGVGASFKAASLPSRLYHLVPNSKSFMFAFDGEEYLRKDGLWDKFLSYRRFINNNTGFKQGHEFKNAEGKEMFVRASYADDQGLEHGLMSEVMGVSIQHNPDKARGKRGEYLLFEEAGKFPNLDKAWKEARDSVEEGGVNYGTMICFGTGGSKDDDYRSLKKFVYNPRTYNVLAYNNEWDEGLIGTDCALFCPATFNVQHIDKDGNTNHDTAKAYFENLRQKAKQSTDSNDYTNEVAEHPFAPSEALNVVRDNEFNIKGMHIWARKVQTDPKIYGQGVPKRLEIVDKRVTAIHDPKLKPVLTYPHQDGKGVDLDGCVLEYELPYKINGEVPDGLYFICHDPYFRDDAVDRTSLGAAYVMMNFNNICNGDIGDRIVASYIGRPDKVDDYNENLFLLARRWNAKIVIENDKEHVIDYAKRFKLINWLVPELELPWDDNIKTKNLSARRYGVTMSSGKANLRILSANMYLADWLKTERDNGSNNPDLHFNFGMIKDPALLQEFLLYNEDDNFDRVSALRVGMFYMRELIYKGVELKKKNRKKDPTKKLLAMNRFQ